MCVERELKSLWRMPPLSELPGDLSRNKLLKRDFGPSDVGSDKRTVVDIPTFVRKLECLFAENYFISFSIFRRLSSCHKSRCVR
jgi:hypothetical protein